MSRREKRKRVTFSWKIKLAFVLFSSGLALIFSETAIRVLPITFRSFPRYQPDRICGSILQPGSDGWQQKEGRVYISVNRQGFRDIDHAKQKPARTIRIAVLGDSYAEAVQVELESTFWSILANDLKKCLPADYSDIEVLNFGISGYGTAQELLVLQNYVWDYSPDLVVLAFLPSNDIRNNSKQLEPQKQRPFYELNNDELRLDNSFRDDPDWQKFNSSYWIRAKDWAIRNFELAALIYNLRHNNTNGKQLENEAKVEAGLSSEVYYPPKDKIWEEAWELTGRLLEEIHNETSKHNVPLVAMSVTSSIVVNPDKGPREELASELGVANLFYPDRWLEQQGNALGFPVLQLSEAMQKQAEKEGTYFHGFSNTALGTGHWNHAGHA